MTVRKRWSNGLLWAMLSLFAVAALALSLDRAAAAGDQKIVIHGADSGSHLRLTVSHGDILVNGYMAPGVPELCRLTQPRTAAVCPAGDVDAVEIVMGPSDDKIEILDAMPTPVVAYLGNGSDKLIGNAEPDTCYPQGARRNRCYGGGGNDICITGPRNSDCVGDGGDDYAEFGTGSDGCWGDYSFGGDNPARDDPRQGPSGDDICLMGPGKDGAHGGPGHDLIDGGASNDKLFGQAGNDVLLAGGGSNKLFGGPGDDAVYVRKQNKEASRLDGGPGHDVCYGVVGRDGFHDCEVKIDLRAKGAGRPSEQQLRQGYLAAWY